MSHPGIDNLLVALGKNLCENWVTLHSSQWMTLLSSPYLLSPCRGSTSPCPRPFLLLLESEIEKIEMERWQLRNFPKMKIIILSNITGKCAIGTDKRRGGGRKLNKIFRRRWKLEMMVWDTISNYWFNGCGGISDLALTTGWGLGS